MLLWLPRLLRQCLQFRMLLPRPVCYSNICKLWLISARLLQGRLLQLLQLRLRLLKRPVRYGNIYRLWLISARLLGLIRARALTSYKQC
jgi:hypothetical protein